MGVHGDKLHIHKEVLDELPYPLAIWRLKDGKCKYVNNKMNNIKIGIPWGIYMMNDNDLNKFNSIFDLDSNDEIIVKKKEHNVYLKRIGDKYFYELWEYNSNKTYNFLSIISRKIRGPLTNIIGSLSLIEDLDISTIDQKYIDIMKDSSLEIVSLANEIVDLLNISKNKLKLDQQICNFHRSVEELMIHMKNVAKKQNIKLNYKIGKTIPESVITDCERLIQILGTIIKNSIDYTDDGIISISITEYKEKVSSSPFKLEKVQRNKLNILFKIKDTGVGINPDCANMLRETFNNTTKFHIENNRCGFSLIIASYLVGLMGGNIWFETYQDIGTVVYFNIILHKIG